MKNIGVLVVILVIALTGCFGNKKVAGNIDSDDSVVLKAQNKFLGYTLEQYQSGRSLYETNCNKCHGLKTPKNYSEEEWAKLVPAMSKKANDKKGSNLTDEDQMLIYQYVIAVSH